MQRAKISKPIIADFLQKIYKDLDRSSPLFAASASTCRKRWDILLLMLRIPVSAGLTPTSMRAGGAVKSYREDEDVSRLLWKMRLKSVDTLQRYLQEVGAESAFLQLPRDSKQSIVAASALFEVYLQQISSDGSLARLG